MTSGSIPDGADLKRPESGGPLDEEVAELIAHEALLGVKDRYDHVAGLRLKWPRRPEFMGIFHHMHTTLRSGRTLSSGQAEDLLDALDIVEEIDHEREDQRRTIREELQRIYPELFQRRKSRRVAYTVSSGRAEKKRGKTAVEQGRFGARYQVSPGSPP